MESLNDVNLLDFFYNKSINYNTSLFNTYMCMILYSFLKKYFLTYKQASLLYNRTV